VHGKRARNAPEGLNFPCQNPSLLGGFEKSRICFADSTGDLSFKRLVVSKIGIFFNKMKTQICDNKLFSDFDIMIY